jgi:3-oxoacyl-[acyl-carrier protein] reductase
LTSTFCAPAAAREVADQALSAFGRIDALLNIAGAVPQIELFDMTDEQWEGGLALDWVGATHGWGCGQVDLTG